ncbi:alpha/beta hydrolase [Streptomyces sp. R44]|uniref:Alpha/beta hydrolase n=1 Tax=Streptomyces sp. R44 TaxID=3238633 RepID=A0AB39SRH1_9ACTN
MSLFARNTRQLGERLILRQAPLAPVAAVILLPGGHADGLQPPPRMDLAALRMRPFSSAVLRAVRPRPVCIACVTYRRKGWNGAHADAARYAHTALADIREHAGDIPIILIGHSMGGRAALRVAGDPAVRGVVALAPWCPPGDPVDHLTGRRLFLLHDEADRVTSAQESWNFIHRARAVGADAVGIRMPAGGHTMLRRAGLWHRQAAYLVAQLLDDP